MQSSDELDLLKRYTQTRSEAVFAEIVERYLNLVYSAAFRIVGEDMYLAQDVSQMVFCDLAQRAARNCSSLRGLRSLSGWLYQSACFTASKVVRSEKRRQVRQKESHAMSNLHGHSTTEFDWKQLRPEIDAAMLELRDSDREAVLLRYFEGQKLAEIANKLGVSENAARMRIERALERLRSLLQRRGVTSTATALGVALAEQSIVSAPSGLAASITAASMVTVTTAILPTTSTIGFIMASTKAKLGLTALVAALATTPVVIQYQRTSRLAGELSALRQQVLEMDRLRAELERLKAEAQSLESQRAQERAELARLRGELTALKSRESKPIASSKAREIGKSPAQPANAAPRTADELVRAEEWSNVGLSTPSATVQTLQWAKTKGDTNVIFDALAWPDESSRAGIEAVFAAAPEEVRARYGSADAYILSLFDHSGATDARHTLTSFRVVEENISGDEAVLQIENNWADGSSNTGPMRYVRIGNDWRQALDFDAPSVGKVGTSLQAEAGSAGAQAVEK